MESNDSFFKLAPFATGFIIFAGVLQAKGYYGVFKLDILDYLEFSEIIILFLDDLLFIGFALLLSLIGISVFNRTSTSGMSKKAFVLVLATVLGFAGIVLFIRGWEEFLRVIFGLIVLGVALVIFFLATNLQKTHFLFLGINIAKPYYLVIIMASLLSLLAYSNGFLKAWRLIKRYESNSAKFFIGEIRTRDGKVVAGNSELIWVGRCRNYTFFYSPITDERLIISNDDIISIKMTRN